MLDDYSLRLLAEIGVDVYLPRGAANASSARASADEVTGSSAATGVADVRAGVAFYRSGDERGVLCSHVLLALRTAGLRVIEGEGSDLAGEAGIAAVVVLGEARARAIGAGLPAQRHGALEWVIAGEAAALARGATPKRALWGEIKRLARIVAANG